MSWKTAANYAVVALAVVALAVGAALAVYFELGDDPASSPASDGRVGETAVVDMVAGSAPVEQTLPDNAAWRPVDAQSADPARIPDYKETVEGAVLVALADGMATWRVGDEIAIAVPQIGALYRPMIERVDTALGNNRSYIGRLAEGVVPHSFVITVGERNTFANLSTPRGAFELVGNSELAWLMPVANMDRHVDYSKPDYFIPERGDSRSGGTPGGG